jgi:RNA polymerase sigma-70 factor (ECF subfamily)
MLLALAPSPIVRLNRAIALWKVEGAAPALHELEAIAAMLDGYHLFHAARAELLNDLGHRDQARAAQRRALDLTENCSERSLLVQRFFR